MSSSLTLHTVAQNFRAISKLEGCTRRSQESCFLRISLQFYAKLWAFLGTYENYASRIDLAIAETSSRIFQQNQEVLRSVLKCLEFCGRQGIALRGHRDDETSTNFNKGNFKALLALRVDAGDKDLEHHLETCARNATYTSKTTQNELCFVVRNFYKAR